MAWNWGISLITFAFGLGIGFLIAYLAVPRNGRIQALEEELRAERARNAEYRGQVNRHFQKTAELFEDMTGRYRAVYEHMASGAQQLCEERPPSLQLEIVDRGRQPRAVDAPAQRPLPPSTTTADPETEFDLQVSTAPHASWNRGRADDDHLGDAPRVPELTDEVDEQPVDAAAKTGTHAPR